MAIQTESDSWWTGAVNWLAEFLNNLAQTFIGWVTDAAFFVYDSFMDLFQTMIVNFPVPDAWANADPWSGLSPQIYYMLDKFNIGTCLGIVFAGWTIRWMLNFIPAAFTRI